VARRRAAGGMRIEIVAIGTELLLGQIADTNSAWLGEHLAAAGIDSHYHQAVGDNQARIALALRTALARSDGVIVRPTVPPALPARVRHSPRHSAAVWAMSSAATMIRKSRATGAWRASTSTTSVSMAAALLAEVDTWPLTMRAAAGSDSRSAAVTFSTATDASRTMAAVRDRSSAMRSW